MSPSNVDGETTAGASARARQGVEHLQTAARELIEAARAALDVAEEVVNDPETLASLAGSLATMGDVARRVTGAGGWPPPGAGSARHDDDGAGADDGDGDAPRVQRITVT